MCSVRAPTPSATPTDLCSRVLPVKDRAASNRVCPRTAKAMARPRRHRRSLRPSMLLLIVLNAVSFVHAAEPAPERVVWNKAPITVHLEVAAERRVQFPSHVKAGLPVDAMSKLQVLAVDDTLYLLASKPLHERLAVQEIETGRIYLLDVIAEEQAASSAPVMVMNDGGRHKEGHSAANSLESDGLASLGFVALTRYAAQHVYAPRRLLENTPGIVRMPLRGVGSVPLVRGGEIDAVPLASWRSREYFVTAVRLKNLTRHTVAFDVFDPRAQLRGRWETASFHHRMLRPRGEPGDASALFFFLFFFFFC